MKNILSLVSLSACLIVFAGCSKAGSSNTQDTTGPTNPAPTGGGQNKPGGHDGGLNDSLGTYRGYIEHTNSGMSPDAKVVGLTPITINRSLSYPSPGQTVETVTINVGYFGGVKIATTQVKLDDSTNTLTATFGSVELDMQLSENAISSALIHGPQTDFKNIQILGKVEDAEIPASSRDVYDLRFKAPAGRTDVKSPARPAGRLTLNRQIGTIPSAGASDLPQLPAVSGSLAFDGMGDYVTPVPAVFYDPLRGTIEMTLANHVVFRLQNVFVEPKNAKWGQDPTSMTDGHVLQGSSEYASMSADLSNKKSPKFEPFLKPFAYTGSMVMPDGRSFDVRASLYDQHLIILNSAEFSVPGIPSLVLRVSICGGNDEAAHLDFTLNGLEPIFTVANFLENRQVGSGSVPARATFGPSWSSINASIHPTDATTKDIELKLKRTSQSSGQCN